MVYTKIEFSVSAWLLLLIAPALAFIFGAFFFKKRTSRPSLNQIISTVLQSIVMILLIVALSGFNLTYEKVCPHNELVVLVDQSFTYKDNKNETDNFVHKVLLENGYQAQVAVVLFAYNQKIALEMGYYEAEEAYQQYLSISNENTIDNRATNIAEALNLAYNPANRSQCLIQNPESAKILLISDGLETDGDAVSAIKAIIRDGVKIDTSFYPKRNYEDIAILGVEYPENVLATNEQFNLTINVTSPFISTENVKLILEDKDVDGVIKSEIKENIKLCLGNQSVSMTHMFDTPGYHQLSFHLEAASDMVEENNLFYSYYDVLNSNWMLIVEHYHGESENLKNLITDASQNEHIQIEQLSINEANNLSLEQMSKYNEIIIYNIAEKDMSQSFQENIYDYTNILGGGVFTVGGFEKNEQGEVLTTPDVRDPNTEVAIRHTYQENNSNSKYASMLPVTFEKFEPAVAIVFVVDTSDSMASITGAPIYIAVEDAKHSLNYLSNRDYVGIVLLREDYQQATDNPLVPMTQRATIEAALDSTAKRDLDASTKYAPALEHAVDILRQSNSNIVKKHIVLLSDGGPGDKFDSYGPIIQQAHEDYGITMTVMTYYKNLIYFDGDTNTPYYFNHDYTVKGYQINKQNMENLAKLGEGTSVFASRTDRYTLEGPMVKDLKLSDLQDISNKSFSPTIGTKTSVLDGISESKLNDLTLKGYFPAQLKINSNVVAPILANSSPLYAEWKLGNGKVGSIMIDLEGYWSEALINSDVGRLLIKNITNDLCRVIEMQTSNLDVTIVDDNYNTQVNVYDYDNDKNKNTKLIALVETPNNSSPSLKFDLNSLSLSQNRFNFANKDFGVYVINVLKVKSAFNFMDATIKSVADIPQDVIIDSNKVYHSFSYSKEFAQNLTDYTTGQNLMQALSTREAKEDDLYNRFIYDATEIYNDYSLVKVIINPRQFLFISALLIYLIDIALRKFKIFNRP